MGGPRGAQPHLCVLQKEALAQLHIPLKGKHLSFHTRWDLADTWAWVCRFSFAVVGGWGSLATGQVRGCDGEGTVWEGPGRAAVTPVPPGDSPTHLSLVWQCLQQKQELWKTNLSATSRSMGYTVFWQAVHISFTCAFRLKDWPRAEQRETEDEEGV